MSNPINIQDELKNLESGLPVNKIQPFFVPEGYFEGLAATILAKVNNSEPSVQAELDQLSPLLAAIPKAMPYSVPSFYFQNSIESINGVAEDGNSSLLDSIGKEIPFAVPQGYFENLPNEILTEVASPKAKVVPLFARTWMRVASAAVVAGALFFGGYQLLKKDSSGTSSTAATKSTPKNEDLLANNTQPIEKQINQISTKELEEFIATVQINPETTTEKTNSTSDKADVEKLLKDVSTTEMESFLSALPGADNDFLLTD